MRALASRFLTGGFAVALILSTAGCFTLFNASSHPGTTSVAAPSSAETNPQVWKVYYYDQFDAYEGQVVAPTGDAPEAQRQGYQLAASEYASREKSTNLKNLGVAAVAWAAILVALPFIVAGAI